MKRLLLLLSALIPLLAHAYDFSVENDDGVTIYYDIISSNEVSVTYPKKWNNWCSGSVSIPNNVQYSGQNYSVTSIGEEAFDGCKSLTSVTIPNSVTSIGNFAFDDCSSLTSVTIPDSVTSIGERAFSGCTSLMMVAIPNSVTSIGEFTFSGCTSLTCVTIPDSLTDISNGIFNYCSSLKSVSIPHTITSIGEMAFRLCYSLTNVTIPNSVTYIGEGTFWGCDSLTNITIPNSITSIPANTFGACGLTSLSLPNSITSIGKNAFGECMNLTNVTIPNSVISIGKNAFWSCRSLTNVTIPNSVTAIGEGAFSDCDKLFTYSVESTATSISVTGINGFRGVKPGIKGLNEEKQILTDGNDSYRLKVLGLKEKEEEYKLSIGFFYNDHKSFYQIVRDVPAHTDKLTVATLPAKALNTKTALLCAETNADDEEDNIGFEWRRYDAPESLPSYKVVCAADGGVIQGALGNLNPEVYYKYRPYYTDATGTSCYGEWMTFFTGDASVFFDPTVKTYSAEILDDYSAVLKGYALRGSNEIASQGFQFWPEWGGEQQQNRAAGQITEVEASGYRITATLNNLSAGATYSYRAYVRDSEGNYTYGDTKQFTTTNVSGIEYVATDSKGEISLRGSLQDSNLEISVDGNTGGKAVWHFVNLNGQTIGSGEIAADGEWHPVEVTAASRGIYVLAVRTASQHKTFKIILK